MTSPSAQKNLLVLFAGLLILIGLFLLIPIMAPSLFSTDYRTSAAAVTASSTTTTVAASTTPVFVPRYMETPEQVKGIYMTSWVAGTSRLRNKLVSLLDTTEANTLIIDVKDYSGRISFTVQDLELIKVGSEEKRIADLPQFIESLHQKGIYVIARIAVFQDAYYVKMHPELAVKKADGKTPWKDRKGISWIDPGAEDYWKYIVRIGHEARAAGFDELNFDYIRYPSDGDLKDISYPWSGQRTRTEVMKSFYAFLHDEFTPKDITISADLFGLVTTANDDLGIGQVLVDALPYFDYISPMVYPSHFGSGYGGFKNPSAHPYEVIRSSMGAAVTRAGVASTSPLKLRPWLQDFDLGADYTAKEVRSQIQATYDVGLNSWLLWSASNVYSEGGLELNKP